MGSKCWNFESSESWDEIDLLVFLESWFVFVYKKMTLRFDSFVSPQSVEHRVSPCLSRTDGYPAK